ncbi:hypothetical protein GALMADRAFT_236805, partial [Galerina marginata CBS 339.88]
MRGLGRERSVGAVAAGGGGATVVHPDLSLGLGVRDFAPVGSGFGGPSELTSFFPAVNDGGGTASEGGQSQLPEHALISQLLVKVQELEETNTRILRQQTETATQLSAVQRDTAHITKVYETLADPEAVELELEDGARSPDTARDRDRDRTPSMQTIRFMSLRRTLEDEMSMSTSTSLEDSAVDLDLSSTSFGADGTCIVRPDFLSTAPKNRKSVMGLFDEPRGLGEDDGGEDGAPGQDRDDDDNVFGTFGFGPSSLMSTAHVSSGPRPPNTNTNTNSGALSPLHFLSFSPALTSRPTLQTELNKEFGDGQGQGQGQGHGSWSRHNHHLRASSLYDISQFSSSDAGSAPPSPSPLLGPGLGFLRPAAAAAAASGRRVSDWDGDEDEDEVRDGDLGEAASTSASGPERDRNRDGVKLGPGLKPPQRTPLLMSSNSLRLAVEPPTPDKPYEHRRRMGQTQAGGTVSTPILADGLNLNLAMDSDLDLGLDLEATKSPRIKMISETLRARTNRWVERRIRRSRSRSRSDERRDGERRTERDERRQEREREKEQHVEEERRPRKKKSMIGDRLSLVVDGLVDRFDTFSGAARARPKLQSRSRSRSRSGSRSKSRSRSRRRADKELEEGVEVEGAGYDEYASEDGSSRAPTPMYHDAKSDTHSNSNPDSPLSSPPPEEAEAEDLDPTAQPIHTHKTSSQTQIRKLK